MLIFYLITILFMADGTAVPVVQGRTTDAAECQHLAAVLTNRGTPAFCAVEQLTPPHDGEHF